MVRMIGAGVAENRCPPRHPLTEFVGKRRERSVIDAEGAQPVASKGDGDPPRVEGSPGPARAAAPDTLDDSGQPGPCLIWLAKAQEAVSRRNCARPGQEKMLNVVQFQHRLLHPRVPAFTA